jgi:hypothetical protein
MTVIESGEDTLSLWASAADPLVTQGLFTLSPLLISTPFSRTRNHMAQARSILDGTDGWGPLRAGIEDVASALIRVGRDGADVNCSTRRNKPVFP